MSLLAIAAIVLVVGLCAVIGIAIWASYTDWKAEFMPSEHGDSGMP